MGIAIIINDADFSALNLGKVTIKGEVIELQSLMITGLDTITDLGTYQYSISYQPSNTTQTGVEWSILSPVEKISIDANSGSVTVQDGATNTFFTIRAVSTVDNAIYAEKTITLSLPQVEGSTPILSASLINGDIQLKGSSDSIEPIISGYLSSGEDGTVFNRSKGFGLVYSSEILKNVKSFSFEYYADASKSGALANSWGALMNVHTEYASPSSSPASSEPLVINKYPDNGVRFEAATNKSNGTPTECTVDSSTNASVGTWHKVCAVTDFDFSKKGTTSSYSCKYYADGTLIGTAKGYYILMVGSDLMFVFGNSWRLFSNGINSSDVNPFCGKIRNIKMYNTTLTEDAALKESTL
jgi:hypothetical protein